MRKIVSLTWLLILFCLGTYAKHIDESTAKKVGQMFLLHSTKTLKTSVNLNLVYKSSLNGNTANEKTESTTFYYIFNYGTDGFVIVSGDDNITPILGYSEESVFDPNNIPQNVKKWLEEYKNQILFVIDNNIQATQEIEEEWTNYINGSNIGNAKATSVNPLMTTKWNQSPYYNAFCPNGSVTGCVATAMAQIMKYWNYPTIGTGFHSYNHQTFGTLSANFGATTYQWSSMPNIVNSSNNAVATLMYHCGVSVDMNYSPQVSGAYVISAQSPVQHCSEYALKTYFGYKNTLQGVQRSNYNQTAWLNLLKAELNASRPILYAGFGSGGGHCFVADGYDNNDYIHFNWGWGGAYDGYFQINALNPSGTGTGGGTGGYNSGHQAVIGIEPPTGGTPPTYDLKLYSDITMPSTQIWFTNAFSLNVDIANLGTGSFSGQFGAAIFDQNYNFVDWLEVKSNMILGSNQHYTNGLTFNNAGSTAFVPGTYYAVLYYKTTTQNWTIIGDGNYTNLKQFQIIYSAEIETNSAFTITTNGGRLIQGQSTTVNVDVLNTGSSTFIGQYRVSLSNLNGAFAQSIQILNESNGLPNGYHYTGGNNFTGAITVTPGTYLMEVAYKAQGSSNWYYAGSSNFSNPVYVIVEAPGLSPDQYENNNSMGSAYTLPISFSGNTATKSTVGSNLHLGTDNDYYKINLQTGYNYIISARLHDSYNSGNGNIYSVDGLFSYSTDGFTWSYTYDDIMTGNITVQNGGTVYFHVAPYFSGETGTYLLDMTINRTPTVGIEQNTKNLDLINVYPNPAKDYVFIELNEFSKKANSINIININGQKISTTKVTDEKTLKIPLQGLSAGVYFVQIYSEEEVFAKKIIVNQ
jgi:hypothetical protein